MRWLGVTVLVVVVCWGGAPAWAAPALRPTSPDTRTERSLRDLAWTSTLEASGKRLVAGGIAVAAIGLAGVIAGVVVMFTLHRSCSGAWTLCGLGDRLAGLAIAGSSFVVGAVIAIPLIVVGHGRVLRARFARAARGARAQILPTEPRRRRGLALPGGASVALLSWSGRY